MSTTWVIIRKPTNTRAVDAASVGTSSTMGMKVDRRKSTPVTTEARPVRAPHRHRRRTRRRRCWRRRHRTAGDGSQGVDEEDLADLGGLPSSSSSLGLRHRWRPWCPMCRRSPRASGRRRAAGRPGGRASGGRRRSLDLEQRSEEGSATGDPEIAGTVWPHPGRVLVSDFVPRSATAWMMTASTVEARMEMRMAPLTLRT